MITVPYFTGSNRRTCRGSRPASLGDVAARPFGVVDHPGSGRQMPDQAEDYKVASSRLKGGPAFNQSL
jgi:hypothetical protein